MRPYPIGNGTLSPRIPREVAALLDALQLEGANTDALLTLEQEEWRRLLEFCDLAHLALPLSQVNLAGAPDWVVNRLRQNAADNAQRFERVQAVYLEAAVALARADVAHLVLKGFSQVPDYVADPGLRMQCDIDIYCPHEDLERAQATLVGIGYRPAENHDRHADHLPALIRPGLSQWRGNPYDPDLPPGIEVHFCFWNASASLIEIPEAERFWERRVPRKLGTMEFRALHPVDQLGYLALHVLRGVLSGDWVIHHVYELATFVHRRARDVEFWSQWHAMHSATLRRIEALAFGLARKWFSCALPGVTRVEIDRLPPAQRRWLDRYGGSPLEAMFRHNKDGRLLQILLTRSKVSRQSVLRRIMWPSRWPQPDAPAVRLRYRRAGMATNGDRSLLYARFLVRMVLANLGANMAFLLHGARLWIATRALSASFWAFLGVSFFLTSASQPIFFYSICF